MFSLVDSEIDLFDSRSQIQFSIASANLDRAFLLSRVSKASRQTLCASRVVGNWEIGAVSEEALDNYIKHVTRMTQAEMDAPMKLREHGTLVQALSLSLDTDDRAELAAVNAILRMLFVTGQLRQVAAISTWHRPCGAIYWAERAATLQAVVTKAKSVLSQSGILATEVLRGRLPVNVSKDEETVSLILGHLIALGAAEPTSDIGKPFVCLSLP